MNATLAYHLAPVIDFDSLFHIVSQGPSQNKHSSSYCPSQIGLSLSFPRSLLGFLISLNRLSVLQLTLFPPVLEEILMTQKIQAPMAKVVAGEVFY